VAPPFQLDPQATQLINVTRGDMFATLIKTRNILAESRELLARIDAILAADPFLRSGL
jgi:hypothetical protein